MSYILHEFDGLAIPGKGFDYASHDITPGEVQSGLVSLPGGLVYDSQGSEWARSQAQQVTARGKLVGTSAADLKTQLDAWLAKRGKRATLSRLADDGVTHHNVTARLLSVKATRSPGQLLYLPVELTFELVSFPWAGALHNGTVNLDATPKTITLANDGNARVTAVAFTITAKGSPITGLTIAISGVSQIQWAGTLPVNKALLIDCGLLKVTNDGASAYSGFSLGVGHVIDDWIRLEPGNNNVIVTRTGGDNTSTIQSVYYDGWA